MRTSGTVATVLIFLLGIAAAQAAETYPSEVRTITATSATSSCIGAPKTPVCAVETFRACDVRLDIGFCHRVGVGLEHDFFLPEIQQDLRYRILSMRILRPRDIPAEFRDTYWMKPGYAEIVLLELPDSIRGTCPEGCKYDYVARPLNGEWQIVAWSAWGIDD